MAPYELFSCFDIQKSFRPLIVMSGSLSYASTDTVPSRLTPELIPYAPYHDKLVEHMEVFVKHRGCHLLSRNTTFQTSRNFLFRGLLLVLNHLILLKDCLGEPSAAPVLVKSLLLLCEVLHAIGDLLYPARPKKVFKHMPLEPVNGFLPSVLSTTTIFKEFLGNMAWLKGEIEIGYHLQWEDKCLLEPTLVQSIVLALLEVTYFLSATIVKTTDVCDQETKDSIIDIYNDVKTEILIWKDLGGSLEDYIERLMQEFLF